MTDHRASRGDRGVCAAQGQLGSAVNESTHTRPRHFPSVHPLRCQLGTLQQSPQCCEVSTFSRGSERWPPVCSPTAGTGRAGTQTQACPPPWLLLLTQGCASMAFRWQNVLEGIMGSALRAEEDGDPSDPGSQTSFWNGSPGVVTVRGLRGPGQGSGASSFEPPSHPMIRELSFST